MEIAKVANFLFYSSTEDFERYTRNTLLRENPGEPADYNPLGEKFTELKTFLNDYKENPDMNINGFNNNKRIQLFNQLCENPFTLEGHLQSKINFFPTITNN